MRKQEHDAVIALGTERWLFPATRALTERDATGVGKVLLVRPTGVAVPTRANVRLDPVVSEEDWRHYTNQRIEVEAEFGADPARTRSMVSELRERSGSIGFSLNLARDADQLVGAIARFRLTAPHRHWARLQEVDVFPAWRGRGYGDAVLAAILGLLRGEGSTMAVVGADEDDWPLSWYRSRGFHDVARVPLTRGRPAR